MSKVAIVFWSATGNTETMANCIAEGAGANGTIVPCAEMTPAKLAEFDVVAFGCPAMGAEQLEESEFEPMFAALEGSLNGKKIALFGSYGWGDGQWMRDWAQRAQDDGAQLFSEEGLICNETPDDDVQAACRKLGADLAAWENPCINSVSIGQPLDKEVISMENIGVTCDVCACCHNVDGCKCDLPQIKVTEQCNCTTQQVETPHYCQSYEEK